MKILLVDPAAPWAVADVWHGYFDALTHAGHTVIPYSLTARLDQSMYALNRAWTVGGKKRTKPTEGDYAYRASEGILTAALREQPDWVLVVSGMYLHPDFLIFLRRAGLRVGLICTESPYGDEVQARLLANVDCAWTQEMTSVELLRLVNPNVWYLPAASDATRHTATPQPGDDALPAHDVVFVGTGFQERVDLLEAVNWDGIDLGLYGYWRELPRRSQLRRFVRGAITDNAVAAGLYRRAKIGLNLYRDPVYLLESGAYNAPNYSLSPRAYELAACGCFTLSHPRGELESVFGDAVPTFGDAAQLAQRVRAYLGASAARVTKAARLPGLARGHTFDDRVRQIEDNLGEMAAATDGQGRELAAVT